MSFGTGMKKFCFVANYKQSKPYEIYIDRVERNDLCVINDLLGNYDDGTTKLCKIALWTMKQLYPHVTNFCLHDDSQIYCKDGSREFKLSMSYDYILKYNQTWYEKKLGAELPEDLMNIYKDSLKVLDEPIIPLSMLRDKPLFLEKDYYEEYTAAKTPREFINILRKKLGKEFCFTVGKWLNGYMKDLKIKMSPELWYILSSKITSVPGYKAVKLSNENAVKKLHNTLYGGGRKRTMKNTKKGKILFSLKNDPVFTESYMGIYGKDN